MCNTVIPGLHCEECSKVIETYPPYVEKCLDAVNSEKPPQTDEDGEQAVTERRALEDHEMQQVNLPMDWAVCSECKSAPPIASSSSNTAIRAVEPQVKLEEDVAPKKQLPSTQEKTSAKPSEAEAADEKPGTADKKLGEADKKPWRKDKKSAKTYKTPLREDKTSLREETTISKEKKPLKEEETPLPAATAISDENRETETTTALEGVTSHQVPALLIKLIHAMEDLTEAFQDLEMKLENSPGTKRKGSEGAGAGAGRMVIIENPTDEMVKSVLQR